MSTGVSGGTAECAAHSTMVPHHARAASLARGQLVAALADVDGDLTADITGVVSELVSNAARHARPLPAGGIHVTWVVTPDLIEVRVTDGGSPHQPRLCAVGPDDIAGRGLAIVAALADSWGVTRDGTGHCVWARFDRNGR